MEKIRFITDSASDMNSSREDVTILPLHIRFGEEEYADGVTISHKEFYEKLIECDTLPTTSLVSPAVFEEAYEKAVSAGETVIVVTISSKLSGTCQSARIAAEDYEGKVFVVDSLNATIGEQILVEYGLQLKKQGMTAEEIVSVLQEQKHKIHTMGLLDTLEYLKKGGRISPTVAFIGGALAIKPVVAVVDGEIIMLGKARGSKNGSNFYRNTFTTVSISGRIMPRSFPSALWVPPSEPMWARVLLPLHSSNIKSITIFPICSK